MSRWNTPRVSAATSPLKGRQEEEADTGHRQARAAPDDHGVRPLLLPGREDPRPSLPWLEDDLQSVHMREQGPLPFQKP